VYENFTELAKRALATSQDAALSLGHDYIGTEHLLLGLTATAGTAGEVLRAHGVDLAQARDQTVRLLKTAGVDASGGKSARDALASIGIDVGEIQRRADEAFGAGAFRFPRPAFTSRAKNVLKLTLQAAADLGQQRIDTEHVLLGLLEERDGRAHQVLAALNVNAEALRRAILDRVSQQAA
jgi:ATP-dependent Clp protease ATP-binding subunit ClpA